jgi:hypothetical protein
VGLAPFSFNAKKYGQKAVFGLPISGSCAIVAPLCAGRGTHRCLIFLLDFVSLQELLFHGS